MLAARRVQISTNTKKIIQKVYLLLHETQMQSEHRLKPRILRVHVIPMTFNPFELHLRSSRFFNSPSAP